MYFEIGALKNLGVSFKKASGLRACKFIKKRLQHRYFTVKLVKFSGAHLLQKHSRCLVFKISNSNILFKKFSGIAFTHNKSLITFNSHNDKLD